MKHVLLITADQFRGDCLGLVGHPQVKTPNLDELASNGVAFTNHFAGAAPCSPARACLYTGLYQMNNRVCGNGSPLDSRHDTLPLAMRRGGYDPQLFGYTDQSVDPRDVADADPRLTTYEGILPGFTPRLYMSDHAAPWLHWLEERGYQGPLSYPEIEYPEGGPCDPPVQIPPRYQADETLTAFLTDELIRWLGEQTVTLSQKVKAPGWFAHISYIRPHPPFSVPEPYNSMYSTEAVTEFLGETDSEINSRKHPFLAYVLEKLSKSGFVPGVEGLVKDWDVSAFQTIAAIYYGMVTEVDTQIGRIITALKQHGMWENTLIVFTSDHGEMLGDQGLLGKHGYFDQSYHIPLIIRDPDQSIAHGNQVSAFSEASDVFPTIMELLDLPIPATLDGSSLAPFVRGQQPDNWREYAHWEFDFRDVVNQRVEQRFQIPSERCNLCVLRGERYKYVHFAGLAPLLFDLEHDPQEKNNVVELPEYQSVRITMAEALLEWRAAHLDKTLSLSVLTDNGVVSRAQ